MSTADTIPIQEFIQAYYYTVRKNGFIIFHYSDALELALLDNYFTPANSTCLTGNTNYIIQELYHDRKLVIK